MGSSRRIDARDAHAKAASVALVAFTHLMSLYPGTRVRAFDEIDHETLNRGRRLAAGANLTKIEQAIAGGGTVAHR